MEEVRAADGRFERAIARFDEENAKDPNHVAVLGGMVPRELHYARLLSGTVARLAENASESLRLAARCQHLCRWKIPRNAFPLDKAGYHRWRTELKKFHADLSAKILEECGYDQATIERVRELNLKKNFPGDAEAQVLEDALCLVFLEHQFAELAARTEDEKMVNALRKSWKKMSGKARTMAMDIPFGANEKRLVDLALSGNETENHR